MAEERIQLFDEFPPVSKKEWEQRIQKDLGGADYKQKLKWDTGEGFEVLPFYRREDIDGSPPITSGSKNEWVICAPIAEQDIEKAHNEAIEAINSGASGLQFRLNIKSTSGMLGGDLEGIAVQEQELFDCLLQDINPFGTALFFDAGMASPLVMAMLLNNLKGEEAKSGPDVSFSYDPWVYVAKKGQLPKRESLLHHELTELVNNRFGELKPLCADGRFWHHSGATIIQELALALSSASEYLALLTEKNKSARTIAKSINFQISVGSKYFSEIAKLRAMRILWKHLLTAYGIEEHLPSYIHAETSQWNKTLYDPYVNMIRSTTEGMSAAIAGADMLTIHPFDNVFEKPDEFSKRIARNAQIIMKEEAYLHQVADPSAGSYYVEKLTDTIARKAWKLFREIEMEGGLLKSLRNGTVQSFIRASKNKRDLNIATGKRIFVGTNRYPNPQEKSSGSSGFSTVSLRENGYDFNLNDDKPLMRLLREAFEKGAALGDLVPTLFQEDWSKHNFQTITPYRASKAFEELRLATEKSEGTPMVLTLPLGNKKMRKARSTFASGFFGCSGYQIEDPIGFETMEEAIQTVEEKRPEVVVLCSSDKKYSELVPELGSRLSHIDCSPITVLAGDPKKNLEKYKEAGIDHFIHKNCNVLETLKLFHRKLGVTK